jgi:hypothetical protein
VIIPAFTHINHIIDKIYEIYTRYTYNHFFYHLCDYYSVISTRYYTTALLPYPSFRTVTLQRMSLLLQIPYIIPATSELAVSWQPSGIHAR